MERLAALSSAGLFIMEGNCFDYFRINIMLLQDLDCLPSMDIKIGIGHLNIQIM